MMVLTIIGLILAALIVYMFVVWFNGYTKAKVNYEFFSNEHTIGYVLGYLIVYIGNNLMKNRWLDDPLNGAIIMGIGVVIIMMIMINNYVQTKNKFLALAGSIAQAVVYLPVAVVGFFVAIAIVAFFSQVKPVYSINSRD